MPSWWAERSFILALLALYVIATARGQATYWLARWATERTLRQSASDAGWRGNLRRWLTGPGVAAGRTAVERWGLPIVPLCYLTVGFQTVVVAACGVLRMGWVRFSLAQVPGAAAWAVIYATIGFAAWQAVVRAAAGSPIGLAALCLAGVVLIGWLRSVRRRLSTT